MENIVKKYRQRFRKVKEEMARWEELQFCFVSQFINASAIIQRLQIIQDCNNYGVLRCTEGIQDAVFGKQMESLNSILLSVSKTMYRLKQTVLSMLVELALKPSCEDLVLLQRLLVDQPNISMEEVQNILGIIFAEDIC